MCYHTALIAGPDELARRYGRKADSIRCFRPAYRICAFAHPEYPVVTSDDEMHLFRWGLIPFWTRKANEIVTIRNRTVNARAETVFEQAEFRIPILRKRCLVPVSGFFGWQDAPEGKTPYYIAVKDRPVVSLAGVYDYWLNRRSNEIAATFSVITTEANELLRMVNNTSCRMPVILHPDDERQWLDPSLGEERIAALLKPYPSPAMTYEAVRSDFTRKVPGDPSILVPA